MIRINPDFHGLIRILINLMAQFNQADPVLKKIISLSPYSDLTERAKRARSEIAQSTMRKETGPEPRIDAVMYCLAALKKFREMGPQQTQTVTFEIAMLGQQGLDINNPEKRYTLKSLPGEFTGMHLVSYMYVGLRQINPDLDPGIDLEKEYKAALGLFNAGRTA